VSAERHDKLIGALGVIVVEHLQLVNPKINFASVTESQMDIPNIKLITRRLSERIRPPLHLPYVKADNVAQASYPRRMHSGGDRVMLPKRALFRFAIVVLGVEVHVDPHQAAVLSDGNDRPSAWRGWGKSGNGRGDAMVTDEGGNL
jgi:hypothetical protein